MGQEIREVVIRRYTSMSLCIRYPDMDMRNENIYLIGQLDFFFPFGFAMAHNY